MVHCALGLGVLVVPTLCLGASAGAAASPLSKFLLKSGEQTGYTVSGHPTIASTAAGFIEGGPFTASQAANAIRTLKHAGFIKAVEEGDNGAGNREGFSSVLEFKSAAGAKTAAALFLNLAKTGQAGQATATGFTVPGVVGASGVTELGSSGASVNAYWSGGSCAFGSGLYDSTATSASAATAPVVAGIKAQFARVGASCP